MDRDLALEALGALCNSSVTSIQKQGSQPCAFSVGFHGGAPHQMCVKDFICTVLDGDETCEVSRSSFCRMQCALQGFGLTDQPQDHAVRAPTGRDLVIDEDEFFDPKFDYDFRSLKDNETFYRGGEVYERPYGWFRFALKVLNKYDGNAWLGTRFRSTQSVSGEWPVSYHGTSRKGAEGIIEGYYKPGSGQAYGRGIYSTPYIDEAVYYTKTFTSNKTGKTYQVVLQNRINTEYRQKHNNDKYWLVPIPAGTSSTNEQDMVERAIRPYGLLLKEV
ncbi:uncharacterized protein LOC128358581 [Scomber scombrus]|uniref:Uncharacterized protein LOC128358581 n=1 Tax=Scomber scombrus TaxID=13677 RepID=A0AAV1Q1S8_SCOSC